MVMHLTTEARWASTSTGQSSLRPAGRGRARIHRTCADHLDHSIRLPRRPYDSEALCFVCSITTS
jgi:hypothetical protein